MTFNNIYIDNGIAPRDPSDILLQYNGLVS